MLPEAVYFAASCICVASLLYRKKLALIRNHENPMVQGDNRLESHVLIAAFLSEAEARMNVMQAKCSSNAIDLGGIWKFRLFRSVTAAFAFREARDVAATSSSTNPQCAYHDVPSRNIAVPGNWQLQCTGDLPIYANSGYIVSIDQIEKRCENPTGYYSTGFNVPAQWSDRRVIISFGGVDSAFYLFVNKKYVGFSKDSRLPAEFDISQFVKFGSVDSDVNSTIPLSSSSTAASVAAEGAEQFPTTAAGATKWTSGEPEQLHANLLEVVVCRLSDGYLFEDQDMWTLSGIFRDVLLISYPMPLHIYDYSWSIAMELSAISPSNEAFVNTKVKVLWDMWTVEKLLEKQAAVSEESSDSGSVPMNNFDRDGSRSSPHYTQLLSDWVLCVSIYEEGVLLSTSRSPVSTVFNFEHSSSTEPIVTEFSTIPLPLQGEYDEFDEVYKDDEEEDISDKDTHYVYNEQLNSNTEKRRKKKSPSRRRNSKGFSLNDHNSERYLPVTLQQKLLVTNPKYWRPEKPHVYTLVFSIRNATDGSVLQSESCHFGLRTVGKHDGLLCINNQPIMIRGVNYHEFNPVGGHTTDFELLEADIKLMKRNNMNAIRTSHYPQPDWFYELCDVYGMYVFDEANIETHGMHPSVGRLASDSLWQNSYMQRASRMYERNKIHVCIICWSLGNESGYGEIHDRMAAWVRKRDKSRMVVYEAASYGPRDVQVSKTMATDILFPMYSGIDDCVKFANMFPDMPLILSAYSHMMGNSGGNLSDYWTAFHNYPRLQGGFIWDWVDQGLSVLDGSGRPLWGYCGDFGEHCGGVRAWGGVVNDYFDEHSRRRGGMSVVRGRPVGSSHFNGLCGLNFPDRGLGYNNRLPIDVLLSKGAVLMHAATSMNASLAKLKLKDSTDVTFQDEHDPVEDEPVGTIRNRTASSNSVDTVASSRTRASTTASLVSRVAAAAPVGSISNLAETQVALTDGLSPLSYWSGAMRSKSILRVVSGLCGVGGQQIISADAGKGKYGGNFRVNEVIDLSDPKGNDECSNGGGGVAMVAPGVDVEATLSKPALLEAKQCMKRFSCKISGSGVKMNCSNFRSVLKATRTQLPFQQSTPRAISARVLNDYKQIVNNGSSPAASDADQSLSTGMTAMRASVRFNLYSNVDCNGDVLADMTFAGLLMCDGLIVGCSKVSVNSVEYIDVNGKEKVATVESTNKGRCTVQQLHCKVEFNIPAMVYDKRNLSENTDGSVSPKAGCGKLYEEGDAIANSMLFSTHETLSSAAILTKSHCCSFFTESTTPVASKAAVSLLSSSRIIDSKRAALPRKDEPGYAPSESRPSRSNSFSLYTSANDSDVAVTGGQPPSFDEYSKGLAGTLIGPGKSTNSKSSESMEAGPAAKKPLPILHTDPIVVFGLPWQQDVLLEPTCFETLMGSLDDGEAVRSGFWTRLSRGVSGNSDGAAETAPATEWSVIIVGRLLDNTPYAPAGFPMGFSALSVNSEAINGSIEEQLGIFVNLSKQLPSVQRSTACPGYVPFNKKSPVPKPRIFPGADVEPIKDTRDFETVTSPSNESNDADNSSILKKKNRATVFKVLASSKSNDSVASSSKEPLPKADIVSVLWDTDCAEPFVINKNNPPNIKLRVALESATGSDSWNESSQEKFVEAIISTDTGMLLSYSLDGSDVFAPNLARQQLSKKTFYSAGKEKISFTASDDVRIQPSRVQMHRAAVDNDEYGYMSRWVACGLDKDMMYLLSEPCGARNLDDKVENLTSTNKIEFDKLYDFSSLSVKRVEEEVGISSSLSSTSAVRDTDTKNMAYGVEIFFDTKPMEVDHVKIAIMKRLQSFADDPISHTMLIIARNSTEEIYIHQLAAALRFGRESICFTNSGNSSRKALGPFTGDSHFGSQRKRPPSGVTVKLWKPQINKCSTTPKAEALSIGPFGVPPEEEIPYESSDPSRDVKGTVAIPKNILNRLATGKAKVLLSWTLKYLMYPTGELKISAAVDTSAVPVPLPRIGLQFNLRKDLQQVIYKGNGPHESYPDRKSSSVHAVHKALVDELYVPYINPSENGNRTDVHWLQLRQQKSHYVNKHAPSSVFYMGSVSIDSASSSSLSSKVVSRDSSSNTLNPFALSFDNEDAESESEPLGSLPPIDTGRFDRLNTSRVGLLMYCSDRATACSMKGLFDRKLTGRSLNSSSDLLSDRIGTTPKSNTVFSSRIANNNSTMSDYQNNSNVASSKPATRLFNFSAQRFTTEDLALAAHSSELELFPRPFISVNIDPYLMGIGGDDSWSAGVHEEYLVNPGVHTFEVNLSLFLSNS